jgi:glycosyltransferase involved in cell wall biosynthesis
MEDRMKNPSMPRVALISVGLGRVQRGFERWCGDLYGVLRGELDCTLYRSAGAAGRGERVPPFLGSSNAVFRRLPLSRGEKSEYKRDCAAFGFSLLPELLFRRFDVIHCVDPPMAQVLRRIQTSLSLPGRILFTEGSSLTGTDLPRVDHLHLVSQVAYDQVLAYGIPRSNLTLVPSGVHTGRFAASTAPGELRRKYGVSENTFVVLAVSALRRAHKRVDHIIDEVAKLEGDVLLWLDGHVEDADLPEVAARKLGSRCRVTHVPSNRVADLYGMADVMVQASLNEAFGLSVVEALSSGVMVLAHQSPHFEWLVGDGDCLIDMSQPGRLSERLRLLAANRAILCRRSSERSTRARDRFDWAGLAPEYLKMYATVAAKTPARRVA